MNRQARSLAVNSDGFTLVELMVVVVIAAIIAAISLPSYTNQIRKSRRTDAKTALMDLAGREEKLFSLTNTYSSSASVLGYTAFSTPVGRGYYTVTITPPTPTNTFTITATAIGAQAQDTDCASFAVDQTGAQSSLNSAAGDSTAICWK